MKKPLFILAIACLTIVSCKKERVCSCEERYTEVSSTGTEETISKYKITLKDASYLAAQKACVHTKESYTVGGVTTSVDTNCSLQ